MGGKPEIEKAAPERLAAVIVTAAPLALRVPVCEGLGVPSGTEPKFNVAGETLRPAPLPLSVIDGGVFEALLVNDSAPDTVPVAVGEKLTLKLWLCPTLIVIGNVSPLKANPAPVSVSAVTVTLPPVALSVPDCSGLVVPTVTLEKVKLPGEIESTGTVAKFTPVFAAFETVICWLAGLKL